MIYLRKIEISDINNKYLSWLGDVEVNKYLEVRHQNFTLENLKEYFINLNNNDSIYFFAICLSKTDEHIGNIKIEVEKNVNQCNIGLIIGEKQHWGNGIGTKAMELAENFAFNNLKIEQINAGTYLTNYSQIKIFEKLNYTNIAKKLVFDPVKGEQVETYLFIKKNEPK